MLYSKTKHKRYIYKSLWTVRNEDYCSQLLQAGNLKLLLPQKIYTVNLFFDKLKDISVHYDRSFTSLNLVLLTNFCRENTQVFAQC